MNENLVAKDNKKIISIGIIITAIVILSSIVIYSSVIKPKKYSSYLDLGNKYLLEQNYEEAILAFEKAIKINSKSIDARILVSKCYIETNEVDIAIEKLKEAQKIDLENEKLLIKILDIIKDIDGEIAYEILQNYINAVGEDNISNDLLEIINVSNEKPQVPIANPPSGTYEKPISLKLELEKLVVGHTYYYTNDGSEPDVNSQKYRGSINVEKDSEIKIIGYNKNGESSEVLVLKYVIDSKIKSELETIINTAENLHKESIEGEEEYQYKIGSKDILLKEIEKAKELYNNKLAEKTIVDEGMEILKEAISTFESSQIISFTKEMAKQYAIEKYGEPFDYDRLVQRFYNCGSWENRYETSGKLFKDGNRRYYNITKVDWNGMHSSKMKYTILKVYDDGTIEEEKTLYEQLGR